MKNPASAQANFMREYVKKQAEQFKYLTAPPPLNDYLIQRQRGQLEGLAESLYRQNNVRQDNSRASNTSYSRTANYDIASKLGLYNPLDSVNIGYSPRKNLYQKENNQY